MKAAQLLAVLSCRLQYTFVNFSQVSAFYRQISFVLLDMAYFYVSSVMLIFWLLTEKHFPSSEEIRVRTSTENLILGRGFPIRSSFLIFDTTFIAISQNARTTLQSYIFETKFFAHDKNINFLGLCTCKWMQGCTFSINRSLELRSSA